MTMERITGATLADYSSFNDVCDAMRQAGARQAQNAHTETALSQRPLILLLEDEPDQAAPIAETLTFAGYRRIVVRSLERARAELTRDDQHVAVLVADLNLSAPSGAAFIHEIRAMPHYAKLPIIITSGNGAADALATARKFERTAYLLKPFSLTDLLNLIHQWTQGDI